MCNRDTWYGEGRNVFFFPWLGLDVTHTFNRENTWNQERADPYEFPRRVEFMLSISNIPDQRERYDAANFEAAGYKTPKIREKEDGPLTFLEA